jgi:transcriptional regulator CtsR
MGISDLIAGFIDDMLSEYDGTAELQRADVANKFNCVPSQINYVIATRFSPERGYIVESRRGGGGYIRIQRVKMDPKQLVMHTVNAIGDSIDSGTATAFISNAFQGGAISEDTAKMMMAATGEASLKPLDRVSKDILRASILKQMFIKTM